MTPIDALNKLKSIIDNAVLFAEPGGNTVGMTYQARVGVDEMVRVVREAINTTTPESTEQ